METFMVPPHPPDIRSSTAHEPLSYATAGQQGPEMSSAKRFMNDALLFFSSARLASARARSSAVFSRPKIVKRRLLFTCPQLAASSSAIAAAALATVIGIFAFRGNDISETMLKEQPRVATEPGSSPGPDPQQPSEQASRAGEEEGSGQKSPTQDAAPASVDEPAATPAADERPAAVPVPPESAPKPRLGTPAPSSDAKAPMAKKGAAKPKAVKKVEESPSNQWIQTR
jgi:hypothetical protein